jgi:hypothetical protein
LDEAEGNNEEEDRAEGEEEVSDLVIGAILELTHLLLTLLLYTMVVLGLWPQRMLGLFPQYHSTNGYSAICFDWPQQLLLYRYLTYHPILFQLVSLKNMLSLSLSLCLTLLSSIMSFFSIQDLNPNPNIMRRY